MAERKCCARWHGRNARGSFLAAGTNGRRASPSPKGSGNYKFNEMSCLAKKNKFFSSIKFDFLIFQRWFECLRR